MEIHMEMTWSSQDDGSLICTMGPYTGLVFRVGSADDEKRRVSLMHAGEALGSFTLPNERIACQVGEKALSLLGELEEKEAPTIEEVVEETDAGSSEDSGELLGEGDPV